MCIIKTLSFTLLVVAMLYVLDVDCRVAKRSISPEQPMDQSSIIAERERVFSCKFTSYYAMALTVFVIYTGKFIY